jgi:hypothetical protein
MKDIKDLCVYTYVYVYECVYMNVILGHIINSIWL